MRVYCLFFLIALSGAADDTTNTASATTTATSAVSAATTTATSAASAAITAATSAASAASNITLGGLLGKLNSTTTILLNGKHNIITKGVELGNLTAHSIIGLGALAIGNGTEMAQKAVDLALNMGLESMKVARQVSNKTVEMLNSLPGSKYLPTSIISNATNFGIGLGEKGMNASLSAVKAGIKMGNNIGQTVANKTGTVVSSVHNQLVKGHQKITNLAVGAVNNTVSRFSNTMKGIGYLVSQFGNRISNSASVNITG